MNYTLFDTLLEPVFVLNSEGHIIYCNEAAAKLCDSSPRKVVRAKRDLLSFLKFESDIDFFKDLKSMTVPTPYKELKFSSHSLESGKAQITAQPIVINEETTDYLVYFRDVTLEERLQNKYRAELEQKESYIDELKSARNQLEIYSKDLESLVQKRTAEIQSLNILMKALFDSLNQAFFVFDRTGVCEPFYSKACLTILDVPPSGKYIWDILRIEPAKQLGFKNWLITSFDEMLPFEDLKPLGPDKILHSAKSISIEYFPIRNSENQIEKIVCVGSDVTDLVSAQKQAEQDREKVQSILKMIQNRRELKMFLLETQTQSITLNHELDILKAKPDTQRDSILRILHTIKGGAATFSYNNLKEVTHQFEEIMIQNQQLTLPFQQIDSIKKSMDSEVNSIVNFFSHVFGSIESSDEESIVLNSTEIKSLLNNRNLTSIHNFIEEKAFTQPIENLISQFPIVIERTAELLGKSIEPLEINFPSFRVPTKIFDAFFSSFIHVLRNSVDHGIESPSQRIAADKAPKGQLQLGISIIESSPKQLQIIYKDDGRGIDANRIRSKLEEKMISHSHLADEEVIYYIFNPSFSTRDAVTETSGRGVGLDAVKHEVDKLNGNIKINSQLGHYTEFIFTLPYPSSELYQKAS